MSVKRHGYLRGGPRAHVGPILDKSGQRIVPVPLLKEVPFVFRSRSLVFPLSCWSRMRRERWPSGSFPRSPPFVEQILPRENIVALSGLTLCWELGHACFSHSKLTCTTSFFFFYCRLFCHRDAKLRPHGAGVHFYRSWHRPRIPRITDSFVASLPGFVSRQALDRFQHLCTLHRMRSISVGSMPTAWRVSEQLHHQFMLQMSLLRPCKRPLRICASWRTKVMLQTSYWTPVPPSWTDEWQSWGRSLPKKKKKKEFLTDSPPDKLLQFQRFDFKFQGILTKKERMLKFLRNALKKEFGDRSKRRPTVSECPF